MKTGSSDGFSDGVSYLCSPSAAVQLMFHFHPLSQVLSHLTSLISSSLLLLLIWLPESVTFSLLVLLIIRTFLCSWQGKVRYFCGNEWHVSSEGRGWLWSPSPANSKKTVKFNWCVASPCHLLSNCHLSVCFIWKRPSFGVILQPVLGLATIKHGRDLTYIMPVIHLVCLITGLSISL